MHIYIRYGVYLGSWCEYKASIDACNATRRAIRGMEHQTTVSLAVRGCTGVPPLNDPAHLLGLLFG
jgi:hypothetical protein